MGKNYSPNDMRSMAINNQTQMGKAAVINQINQAYSNKTTLDHNMPHIKAFTIIVLSKFRLPQSLIKSKRKTLSIS